MTKKIIFLTLFIVMGSTLFSQEGEKFIYNGNKSYKSNNYKEAEIDYRKSLEANPKSNIAKYNLANSLYKQGNYQEAMDKFKELSTENFSKRELSKVFHNLGNSLLEDKKYEESIDSYINSLKNNPKDEETKYNLAYAREMLRKQQEQDKKNDKNKDDQNKDKDDKNKDKQDQNKDQNGDKNKDDQSKDKGDQNKDKNDQNKDQNGDKNNDKDGDKKDGKDGQQDDNKADNKEQSQGGQKPKISKQDAERILQAMMNDEKELQKKLLKLKSNSNKTEKNW